MMNKTFLGLMLILGCPAAATAQTTLAGMGEYQYDDAMQLWRNTANAAGLTVDSARNRGVAMFDLSHREGDFHRVQEGGQRNQLEFFTERYQTIGKYLYGYGKFRFNMGRTKQRAWCDVMRPYNSNPFFGGSSVLGKYDNQDFDLTAAVGTTSFNGFRFGARLDYQVGDLSRLRDPRSRSQLLDYQITPSVTWSAGNHTLGVAAFYHRRKEKIPNINTVQTDATLKYYIMTGMESAVGTTRGYAGFQREWVDHSFGGELSYGYQGSAFTTLNTFGMRHGNEGVYSNYKYEPGKYVTYGFSFATQNRLQTDRAIHQLDVKAGYEQAYADEYRQELVIESDPKTGYSSYHYNTQITFKKRYQVNLFDASLHYRANLTDGTAKITHFIGVLADINTAKNKHLLPESKLEYGGTNLQLEGGTALLGDRLWVEANAGYHFSNKADLQLADREGDYAQSVMLPDMAFYEADYWRARLKLTWQFPLAIKGVRSRGFVSAYGDMLKTNNSLNRSQIGLSFGIYN